MMKVCKDCEVEKPYGEFCKLSATPDGYDRRCKNCAKEYRRSRSGPIPAEKKCSTCQEVKASSEFSRNNYTVTGLTGKCKVCHKAYTTSLLLREKVTPEEKKCSRCDIVKSKEAFHTSNYSLSGIHSWCKECFAGFYQENKDVYRERKVAYWEKNRDSIYEQERQRRLDNPDRYRQYAQKRLNLQKSAEFDESITIELLRETLGEFCAYCGVLLNFTYRTQGDPYDPTWGTVDHVIPLAKGGGWTKDNLVLACAYDNVSKGNRDVDEWKKTKGYV